MDVKEILQYVKNHPSGKVKIAITDIDGILRGKYISAEKFLSSRGFGYQFLRRDFWMGCSRCRL